MNEKLKKEREKIIYEIDQERSKLFSLEEGNLKKSFGKFFVKPLFLALIFAMLLKYMGLEENKIVGGFIISFFILLFIFSYKTKKDYEKRKKIIEEEKIKIQANIFTLSRKLKEIDDKLNEKT